MNYLLDTNVVSEWVKPQPDIGVIEWLEQIDEDRAFICAVTIAELRHGIERLAQGNRRKRLEDWLQNELQIRFEGRVLNIDSEVADLSGRILAQSEALGHPMEAMDAFIAATAQVHRLMLVTRNTSDFEPVLHSVVNPWRPN